MANVYIPQKEDPLSQIAKGLQIAQSAFGIASDWKKLKAYGQAEDAAEKAQQGYITPDQEREIVMKGGEFSKDPVEGSSQVKRAGPDGDQTLWLKPPKKEGALKMPAPKERTYYDTQSGMTMGVQEVFDPNTGTFAQVSQPYVKGPPKLGGELNQWQQWQIERDKDRMAKDEQSLKKQLTPAESKVDEWFAKEYAEYVAAGGFADPMRQLDQLNDAADKLDKTDAASGPLVGLMPKTVRDVVTPEGAAIQDQVHEVIQRSLRPLLGAQFTEKEGTMLLNRSFNPRMQESENKRRIQRLVSSLRNMAIAKMQAVKYYEENGTLRGFKGRIPSVDDVYSINADQGGGGGSTPPANQPPSSGKAFADSPQGSGLEADVQQYAEQYGVTYQEAQEIKARRLRKGGM